MYQRTKNIPMTNYILDKSDYNRNEEKKIFLNEK